MVPLGQGLASLGQVSNFCTVENDTRPGRSAACTLGKFLEKFVCRCQKDLRGLSFCFFFSKNQNCGSVFAANILRSCEEIEYCQAVPPDTTTDEGIPVWEVLGAISTGLCWNHMKHILQGLSFWRFWGFASMTCPNGLATIWHKLSTFVSQLRVSQLSDDPNQGDHGIAHFWQELRWQGVKFWVNPNLIKLFGMIARHEKLLKLHETVNHLQVSPVHGINIEWHPLVVDEWKAQ